jgi:hypothetical protein
MTSVTSAEPLPGELGRGPLGRASVVLHRYAAISLGCVLASLPAAAGALLLPWEGLAVLLIVLLTGSVAAALSAALAAWRDEARTVHPEPWSAFWRGWRRNAVDVLRAVAPGLVVVGIVSVTVVNIGGAGIGPGYAWLLLGIAGVTTLIGIRVTVLATMFAFRTRDLWRLAAYTLFRVPRATVALLAMVICAVGLVWITNEAALLALVGVLARWLLHHERPVIDLVRDQFTLEGQASAP